MATVWVVEDDAAERELHVRYLKKSPLANHAVRIFSQVSDAIAALKEEHPDFILTDGNTLGQDGVSLAAAVKGKGIGVIVLSADADVPQRLEAAGCTAARFMAKQFTFDQNKFNTLIDDATKAAISEKYTGSDRNRSDNTSYPGR